MFVPCYNCYLRYGQQYTKECDTRCDYAKVVKTNNKDEEIIAFLLDMLEGEQIGMRASAIEEIKNEFGIEL